MKTTYKWVIDRIIKKYEGGYSNDAGDPGGPTMYGITYIDLAEHLGVQKSQTYDMMRHMSLSTAEDIYATKYAKGVHYDDLPAGLDMVILDYGINSGVSRGIRVLQAILGLTQSGVMSDVLVQKAAAFPDIHHLIDLICDERLRFMKGIRGGDSWKRFGGGWSSRVADLRTTSKLLADGKVGIGGVNAPEMSDQQNPGKMGKATHINPNTRKTVAKSGTGAVVVSSASHFWSGSLLITTGIIVAVFVAVIAAYYELVRTQEHQQEAVKL